MGEMVDRFEILPLVAVILSAVVFALAHLIPRRTLAPMALWAFWEGVLLGGIYVLSGSLVTVMIVHAMHDGVGLALFGYQRHSGWLLSSE
jgi:membrane protease YdiL (CAAX protease family)